jgi:transposase
LLENWAYDGINFISGKSSWINAGRKRFADPGKRPEISDEVGRLKRELEKVKEERDILKKAAAYFAKELG